jgi:2-hydroxy-3-keto-5-methylthiopentenyl-1-phosphate phosphatase
MSFDNLDGLGDRVFVTDFDGTMTAVDFYDVVLNHARPGEIPDLWGECDAGRLTHVEALHGIFQCATRDSAVMHSYLPETELDPATGPAVRRLRDAGWEVVVVSAGSSWYIEQLLRAVRSQVRILANPGEFTPQGGLTMTWPAEHEPWYSRHFGVDKGAVVNHLHRRGATVAFAGDGRPDLTASRLVPNKLRFAKGWLADTLEREGLTFRPFVKWSEIAEQLTK